MAGRIFRISWFPINPSIIYRYFVRLKSRKLQIIFSGTQMGAIQEGLVIYMNG
ncbi:MAG: hypothetical protein RJA90_1001 [Bacteroidota bacterium]